MCIDHCEKTVEGSDKMYSSEGGKLERGVAADKGYNNKTE